MDCWLLACASRFLPRRLRIWPQSARMPANLWRRCCPASWPRGFENCGFRRDRNIIAGASFSLVGCGLCEGNRMSVGRCTILISVALSVGSNNILAAEDDWKAERNAPESEQPAICTSLTTLVEREIAKARSIKAALKSSESAPPTSVLEAAQRLMGNKYETDWQREQKRLLEKVRSEALALNARSIDQRCGSIDVDQEIAREAAPAGYAPLNIKKSGAR